MKPFTVGAGNNLDDTFALVAIKNGPFKLVIGQPVADLEP